jgi:hypothetical protein
MALTLRLQTPRARLYLVVAVLIAIGSSLVCVTASATSRTLQAIANHKSVVFQPLARPCNARSSCSRLVRLGCKKLPEIDLGKSHSVTLLASGAPESIIATVRSMTGAVPSTQRVGRGARLIINVPSHSESVVVANAVYVRETVNYAGCVRRS